MWNYSNSLDNSYSESQNYEWICRKQAHLLSPQYQRATHVTAFSTYASYLLRLMIIRFIMPALVSKTSHISHSELAWCKYCQHQSRGGVSSRRFYHQHVYSVFSCTAERRHCFKFSSSVAQTRGALMFPCIDGVAVGHSSLVPALIRQSAAEPCEYLQPFINHSPSLTDVSLLFVAFEQKLCLH